jgi:hypothetical protein
MPSHAEERIPIPTESGTMRPASVPPSSTVCSRRPMGFTVAPYGKIVYAGGFLQVGFEFFSSFMKMGVAGIKGDDTSWTIPLMMQYSF